MELGVICPCPNIAPRQQRINIEKIQVYSRYLGRLDTFSKAYSFACSCRNLTRCRNIGNAMVTHIMADKGLILVRPHSYITRAKMTYFLLIFYYCSFPPKIGRDRWADSIYTPTWFFALTKYT